MELDKVDWNCAMALKSLHALASRCMDNEPIVLLFIDEPDHRQGASIVFGCTGGQCISFGHDSRMSGGNVSAGASVVVCRADEIRLTST